MPEIDQNELIAHVEWNENIHIDENRKRVTELFGEADRLGAQHALYRTATIPAKTETGNYPSRK